MELPYFNSSVIHCYVDVKAAKFIAERFGWYFLTGDKEMAYTFKGYSKQFGNDVL
jgi:hypothetical protein